MKRILAIAFAVSTLGLADEPDPLRGLADPAQRAAAVARILREGTPLLPRLDAATAGTTDAELRKVLTETAAEIRRREPHGLLFSCGLPKMRLTTEVVQSHDFRYALRIENRSATAVVLWPYFSLRVFDSERNEVRRATHIGRWGRGRSGRFLEEVGWITIEPGKCWSEEERLDRYMHDFDAIQGWKLGGPGEYTLEFTYDFDRDATKKLCDPNWEALADPEQPWNRALAFRHTFTCALTIR